MLTFLVLWVMNDNGNPQLVGCFTSQKDLDACCNEGFVYAISGMKDGVPFYTTNYTKP